MADLSNLKIKNTYQNVLQLDSGVLQNLLGNEPNPFIINGNLRYVDGNQQDGYVLKSNAVGDAIWGSASAGDLYISAATLDNTFLRLETTSGSTIVTPVSYWSSDGKGNYANSGLTGHIGVGTTTPNKKLTVVGAISATTDLYIDDNIRGLRGQFGDSPVAEGPIRDLDIRNNGSTYLRLESDTNANQIIEFMNNKEPDFYIQNKFGHGGLIIGSDNKQFLIIGANEGDAIDLYGNTTISGNTVVTGSISGDTIYFNTINGGTF